MPLICLLSLLLLVSNCKKDKTGSKENFEMNGAKFGTLQEVFNAIGDGQAADIKLLQDVEGDGAILPEGKNAMIFLDFGAFRYDLNDGKYIDLSSSEACLSAGEGGAVKGKGFVIKSKGGSLSIEGGLAIEGGLETASETCFEKSFTGSFDGDLTIDGCMVYFDCPEATVNIHQLVVKGENASVQIVEAPEGGIRIDKVTSTLPHPVCAKEQSAATIGEGAQLHVHNFTTQYGEDATCCTLREIIYTCAECGLTYNDTDVEGDYGPCKSDDLVHYDAVPQGDTTFGHVEYWQCPHCGAIYSNANGTNDISGDYLFLPKNFEAGYPFINAFGDLDEANLDPFSILTGIITIVGFISSTGMAIPGLIDDSHKWTDLYAKVDAVSGQLTDINKKIDALLSAVQALPAKLTISNRQGVFDFYNINTMPTMRGIDDILKSTSYSPEEKKAKIREQVKLWAETKYFGMSLYDLALTHMMQFYDVIPNGSVPKMYEDFSNASFLWEHQGYPMRQNAMLRDVVLSGCSFVLAAIYNKDIRENIPGGNRERYLNGMKTVLENYSATVEKDMYRMRVRKDALIKINMGGPNGTCFEKNLRFIGVYPYLKERWRDWRTWRFPRENQEGAAVKSCEKMISDFGGLPLTHSMTDAIVEQYKQRYQKPMVDLHRYLVDSIGFCRPSSVEEICRIIVREDKTSIYIFGHDGKDKSQPHYGPFFWQSYRLAWATDYFGVRSALYLNGVGTLYHRSVPKCSIQSYGTGHFKWFDETSPSDKFCSPAALLNEPADKVIEIKPVIF